MKIGSTVVLRLAAFLAAAGVVYAVTAREPAGGALILSTAAASAYLGLILRAATRESGGQAEESPGKAEGRHVGPAETAPEHAKEKPKKGKQKGHAKQHPPVEGVPTE